MDRQYFIAVEELPDGSYFGIVPDFTISSTQSSQDDIKEYLTSATQMFINHALAVGRSIPSPTPQTIITSRWSNYTIDSIVVQV